VTSGPVELDPRRWPALLVAVTALFMTLLDVSIVNVALPSISRGIGAGPSELQWVVSGYALAFGMVPIIAGRLGDDRGRKRMLLGGVAAFVFFSALVGAAPTPAVLIVARFLQGLAGGLLNPQVSGFAQQLFPPAERGKAFGAIGVAVGVATAAGPVVGGAIIALGGEQFGWRLCFLVNVPIGIASLILCARLLPSPPPREQTRPLDLPGAAFLTAGVFGVLFPAVQFDAHHDLRLAILLLPAAVVLAGFLLWERGPARRRGYPLIDLGLFQLPSYRDGTVLAFIFLCAYTGTPLILALFLQEGLGFTPLQSGLTASAYALGAVFSAPVAGRLLSRMGQRVLVIALVLFGVGVAAAGTVALVLSGSIPAAHVALTMAPALFVAGLGGGGVITPNQALSLAEVDVRGGSTAGGMLQTAQRVGNAVGAAVISAVFYASVTGAAASGPARHAHYGRGYAYGLGVSLAFTVAALVLAIRDVRRGGLPQPARARGPATVVGDVPRHAAGDARP
jgi:EmrB/QacA subfamily drug resistance transporter